MHWAWRADALRGSGFSAGCAARLARRPLRAPHIRGESWRGVDAGRRWRRHVGDSHRDRAGVLAARAPAAEPLARRGSVRRRDLGPRQYANAAERPRDLAGTRWGRGSPARAVAHVRLDAGPHRGDGRRRAAHRCARPRACVSRGPYAHRGAREASRARAAAGVRCRPVAAGPDRRTAVCGSARAADPAPACGHSGVDGDASAVPGRGPGWDGGDGTPRWPAEHQWRRPLQLQRLHLDGAVAGCVPREWSHRPEPPRSAAHRLSLPTRGRARFCGRATASRAASCRVATRRAASRGATAC